MLRASLLPALLAAAALMPATAAAATITVDDGGDALAADGRCTLREAIQSANTASAVGGCAKAAGGDTIVIAVPKVTLSRSGAGEDANATGDLDVSGTVTIRGGGATIDANGLDRAFDVALAGQLTLEDLTVTGGRTPAGADATTPGATGAPGEAGGGVRSAGSLTLRRVTVTGNATGHGGNGAANSGVADTEVTGGAGGHGGYGGGIAAAGPLTIEASSIRANATGAGGNGAGSTATGPQNGDTEGTWGIGGGGGDGGAGGGIQAGGATTITDTRIEQNTTGGGGAGADGHAANGATVTSGTAGSGGWGIGGSGGSGGDGGGLVAGDGAGGGAARVTLTRSLISANATGAGGPGALGYGGAGGRGSVAGTGTGIGGAGGTGSGGSGGSGGLGGGLAASIYALDQPDVTVEASTITGNTTGGGDDGATGFGGPGGNGGTGKAGGRGGDGQGGRGGSGGPGAGTSVFWHADMTLSGATVTANTTSTQFGTGAVGSPSIGGFGSPDGAGGARTDGVNGAIGTGGLSIAGTTALRATIVASNTPDQCATSAGAVPTDAAVIAFPADADCMATSALNPSLRPLGDFGGATPTFALLPGSPAIDAAGVTCGEGADQRGVPRPAGRCDIGAYEVSPPAVAAGAAAVQTTAATLPASVDARRGTTTVHVEFGPTAARGRRSGDVTVPAGTAAAAPVSFALTGLTPATTYHYILVATSLDGATSTQDATFTTTALPGGGAGAGTGTGGAGGTGASGTAPVITRLALAPRAFRALTRKGQKRRGTTVSWSDTAAATVTFTVARRAAGVRKGKACVARPRGKTTKKPRRCTRWVAVRGSLSHKDAVGKNTMSWNGRLRGHALAPGAYRLTATARLGTTTGKAVTATFTVKR